MKKSRSDQHQALFHSNSRRGSPRWFSVFFGLAVAGLIAVMIVEGPRLSGQFGLELRRAYEQRVLPLLAEVLSLEEIEWEEIGSSNLSQLVSKEQLLALSGLKIGQEILSIKLIDIENNLLGSPWLESAKIQIHLPSRIRIEYVVRKARAVGLKKGRPWLISDSGHWIAPMASGVAPNLRDLPVLAHEETLSQELVWLEALEASAIPAVSAIHEVSVGSVVPKMTALVELKYFAEPRKVVVVGLETPVAERIERLGQVAEYVVQNNIDVTTIDIRPGKRIIVNTRR